jgi:hypothetical protein
MYKITVPGMESFVLLRRELQTECILDKIDEYRWNWFLHL